MNAWASRVDKPERPGLGDVRPRPLRRRRLPRGRRGALLVKRAARSHRARELPEDERLARASTCWSRSPGGTSYAEARAFAAVDRRRARARRTPASSPPSGRSASAGACSSTRTRTAPARRQPRLLRPAAGRRAGLDAARLGRGPRRARPAAFTMDAVLDRVARARRPLRAGARAAPVARRGLRCARSTEPHRGAPRQRIEAADLNVDRCPPVRALDPHVVVLGQAYPRGLISLIPVSRYPSFSETLPEADVALEPAARRGLGADTAKRELERGSPHLRPDSRAPGPPRPSQEPVATTRSAANRSPVTPCVPTRMPFSQTSRSRRQASGVQPARPSRW